MSRPLRLLSVTVAAWALLLGAAASADAFIYWANPDTGTIGRANNDGTGVNQDFITGANGPCGVAVTGAHIFWANDGSNTIGRANLDGTGVNQSLATGSDGCGVASDGQHVWWTNTSAGKIGYALVGGAFPSENYITGQNSPCGIALSGNRIFWTNADGTVGRATKNLTVVESLSNPGIQSTCSIAANDSHLYFSQYAALGTFSVARTNLDLNDRINVTSGKSLCGVGLSSSHLYFGDNAGVPGSIARAGLDGSNKSPRFITGSGGRVCGVAVDNRVSKKPSSTGLGCTTTSVQAPASRLCTVVVSGDGVSTPSGQVQFSTDGPGSFSSGGNCTLVPFGGGGASCTLTYTATAKGSGTHHLSVAYAGNNEYEPSSASFNLGVTEPPRPTQSEVFQCSSTTTNPNGQISCIALVTDTVFEGGSPPAGGVTVSTNGAGTISGGGNCPFTTSGNRVDNDKWASLCSFTYTPTTPGTHRLTVSYAGNANHQPSSGFRDITVVSPLRSTTTTVNCSPGSVATGSTVICTATVADSAGAGASAPAGTINFVSDGSGEFTAQASCTLSQVGATTSSSCSRTYRPSAQGDGSHRVTAGYSGSGTHSPDEGSFDVTVSPQLRLTSTELSCGPATIGPYQHSVCTVTVRDIDPSPQPPIGVVSLTTNGPGAYQLDSNPPSFTEFGSCYASAVSADTARCTIDYRPEVRGTGTHNLTAIANETSQIHQQTAGSFALGVTTRPSSTELSCAPGSVQTPAPTTCTVTVSDIGAGPKVQPHGSVALLNDGLGSYTGGGSCELVGVDTSSASCALTYTPNSAGTGSHHLGVDFAGNADHLVSSDSFDLTVTQPPRANTSALDCSPASIAALSPVTCVATVTDTGNGDPLQPAGQVSFSSDGSGTFSNGGLCQLAGQSESAASCQVTYTPTTEGVHHIGAGFASAQHTASSGADELAVTSSGGGGGGAAAGVVPAAAETVVAEASAPAAMIQPRS